MTAVGQPGIHMDDFSVEVLGREFKVVVWTPGTPMLEGTLIGLDTETELAVNGAAGAPVIYQVGDLKNRTVHLVWWQYWESYEAEWLNSKLWPRQTIVMHNAPYDLQVVGADPMRDDCPWLEKAENGTLVDTGCRFLLQQVRRGSKSLRWAMDYMIRRLFRADVEKDDEIRLTYRQDMEVTWRHAKYAALDPIYTLLAAEAMPHRMPTEDIQLLGAIALNDIGKNGMLVDPVRAEKVRKGLESKVHELRVALSYWGYYVGEEGNKRVAQSIFANIEKRQELNFPRTEKTDEIKTDGILEVFDQAGLPPHPFAVYYQDYIHYNKMLSTYLNPELIGSDGKMHPFFNFLVKTGRTSCSGPNLQNVPRKGGLREIYIAEPGHVLFAPDYSQLELCALAETCYIRYGHSTMMEVINSGEDIHRWFGRKIMEMSGGNEKDGINYRQMAKAANFGLPGGLGIATFRTYAKKSYGVNLSFEECQKLKDLWLTSFPEMAKHLSPQLDECCSDLFKGEEYYIASTINGRERHRSYYCPACNYPFQGLAADGAKVALWLVYRSGFKMVNFVHDEIIAQLKIDDNLHESCTIINELMISGMQQVIKNVKIKTDGALMTRWYKEAEPEYTQDGRLKIWRPEAEGGPIDPLKYKAA